MVFVEYLGHYQEQMVFIDDLTRLAVPVSFFILSILPFPLTNI